MSTDRPFEISVLPLVREVSKRAMEEPLVELSRPQDPGWIPEGRAGWMCPVRIPMSELREARSSRELFDRIHQPVLHARYQGRQQARLAGKKITAERVSPPTTSGIHGRPSEVVMYVTVEWDDA